MDARYINSNSALTKRQLIRNKFICCELWIRMTWWSRQAMDFLMAYCELVFFPVQGFSGICERSWELLFIILCYSNAQYNPLLIFLFLYIVFLYKCCSMSGRITLRQFIMKVSSHLLNTISVLEPNLTSSSSELNTGRICSHLHV